MFSYHILLNKGERKNVGNMMGFIKKRITLIHPKSLLLTLTLTNHVPILKFMGIMWITFHLTFRTITRSITNYQCQEKLGFKKMLEREGVTNKGLITKLIPSQPYTMEAIFSCLKVLVMNMVMNMVAQMESNVLVLGKTSTIVTCVNKSNLIGA